jgi:hypothetical protein
MTKRAADEDDGLFDSASVPATTPPPPTTRERLDVIEQELIAEEIPHDLPEQRTFADKMFGIGFSGWFQLVVLCVVVGAIFQAGGIDFFAPNFTFTGFVGALANGALNSVGWVLEVGWRPLLAGAVIVVPVWLAWRLLSVPFRN